MSNLPKRDFDYVEYSAACISCGGDIQDWITHVGPGKHKFLKPVEVRLFEGTCPECGKVNQYDVEIVKYKVTARR